MTTGDAAPGTAEEDPEYLRRITLVDAVAGVYFCAAGKSGLLIEVLTKLGMEILIPAEVETEILQKSGQYSLLRPHWSRMCASTYVTILPALVLGDDRTEVVQHVTRISGREAALALTRPKDLGERIVVGHGKFLQDQGHEVYVVIDDRGGQIMADTEGLTILTVEDLLKAAVELGILTKEQAQTVYKVFIPFGSGLPTWKASSLRKQLQALS